jgi:hypothetical protein
MEIIMSNLAKTAFVLALSTAALSSALAAAAPQRSLGLAPVSGKKGSALAPSAGQTVLRITKISFDDTTNQTVGPGLTAINTPQILTCPNDGGACRIEADENMQVTGGPGGINHWAMCTKVDGALMGQPECPLLGVINPAIFQAGSYIQSQGGLGAGPHTVQTFMFTEHGGLRANYSFVYRLYH